MGTRIDTPNAATRSPYRSKVRRLFRYHVENMITKEVAAVLGGSANHRALAYALVRDLRANIEGPDNPYAEGWAVVEHRRGRSAELHDLTMDEARFNF